MPPKRRNASSFSMRARKKAKLEESEDHEVSDTEFESSELDRDLDDESSYSDSESQNRHTVPPKKGKRGSVPKGKDKKVSQVTKKRQTTAVRRIKNQAGSLKLLLNVPIEIVLEVLRYLAPLDLLHLSSTNKAFRALLMSRSSQPIWKIAWASIEDLPPCPDDMAAAAFTDLLYKSWCHRCFSSKPQMSWSWICRARYCNNCFQHLYRHHKYSWDDIEYGFRPKRYPLESIVPTLDDEDTSYLSDSEHDIERSRAPQLVNIRLDDVVEFVHAWRNVSEADREQFLEERQAKLRERIRHAKICSEWLEEREQNKETIAKAARYDGIVARLKALGWTEVLRDLTRTQEAEFRVHRHVNQSKDVTDRAFRNMLPQLIPILERFRIAQGKPRRIR